MGLLQQLSDFDFPISIRDCLSSSSSSSTEGLDLVVMHEIPRKQFWDAVRGQQLGVLVQSCSRNVVVGVKRAF